MKKQLRRPRPLMNLIRLEILTGTFGILSLLFLPPLLLKENELATVNRPVVSIVIISVLAVMNLVIAIGLWIREQWAFRLGLLFATVTIAISAVGIFILLSRSVLDSDTVVAIVLNGIMLSFFLHPGVAAALRSVERESIF